MANINGEWIMTGPAWDDPGRIRTAGELLRYINKVGFLPLFANEVPSFSAEEHVSPLFWWTGDPVQDPWEWRAVLARSGKVAYGKSFQQKAGFVSLEWLPAFCNWRRDGYDFDSRWEDGLAPYREKKIMDCYTERDECISYELKRLAGFGKEGEKNFDGVITSLEMQTYLLIRDFRRRRRKKDNVEYGWSLSVFATPESLVGADAISSAYRESPERSRQRIEQKIKGNFPAITEEQLKNVLYPAGNSR